MKAIIISSGDELLTGDTLDTNMNWLCRKLTELNVRVIKSYTVGDERNYFLQALTEAIKQAELVMITGGLGPTDDDLTRFVLAEAAEVELIEDAHSLSMIESHFRARNRDMVARNKIQAMLPKGAIALDNHWGTAPGIRMEIDDSCVFALPGVPSEMKRMFEAYIISWIRDRVENKIYRKRIHCIGIGESNLADRIENIANKFPNVRVGTTAKGGIISINLASTDKENLNLLTDEIEAELGDIAFGTDNDTLASVIGGLLKDKKQKVITAESCTGGLIAKLITDVSGSSEYFSGGFVCYSNELKQKLLDVPEDMLERYGAVSEPVANAMAKGAINATNTDWAIAVTGIAGPTGGSADKPVGLVYIAIANNNGYNLVKEFRFGCVGREIVRTRSAIAALNLLRLALIETK